MLSYLVPMYPVTAVRIMHAPKAITVKPGPVPNISAHTDCVVQIPIPTMPQPTICHVQPKRVAHVAAPGRAHQSTHRQGRMERRAAQAHHVSKHNAACMTTTHTYDRKPARALSTRGGSAHPANTAHETVTLARGSTEQAPTMKKTLITVMIPLPCVRHHPVGASRSRGARQCARRFSRCAFRSAGVILRRGRRPRAAGTAASAPGAVASAGATAAAMPVLCGEEILPFAPRVGGEARRRSY